MLFLTEMPAKSKIALGVVILGAGASRRMGRPKLLLPWGATSVIGHLLAQWRALGAAQTCLVCRPDDQPLAAELRRLRFPARQCIVNFEAERGMFSSIVCAARWKGWKPELTAWAIALGDQPHLFLATLRALLACHRKHPQAICQPVFEGHRRHPVILPRDAFFDLQRPNARTLKEFLQQIAAPHVECPIMDPGLSCDLDSPSDYERLLPKPRRRRKSKPENSPLES
jgi:molybdenum cofactor cytidylyltransferase